MSQLSLSRSPSSCELARLVLVAADFEKSIVWIKWIGTHKDYDKIDVKEVRHGG
jgi:mRNA-degrading endonuclease HigB of HigAB toxin-antitoxin module